MQATLRNILLSISCLAMGGLAQAKEGGDQSANGAGSYLAGALPPAGTYLLNYFGHYGGKLQDANGDTLRIGGKEAKVNATFDAMRWVHVTDSKLFGADYGFQLIVPLVHQKVDVFGSSASRSGLGDITATPIILGWHLSKNLHLVGALDIFLPTGAWDKAHPGRQIGANYTSVEPVLAVTYLADNGIEASAKLMYNIKVKNSDTDYRSGQEFHMDYLLAYRSGPWAYGISGYYLKQTTDDRLNGQKIGNRGQVLAFGPSLQYTSKAGDQFILKWDHETQVKNRFAGDKVWLNYVHRF
ncbi:MAG: hypothetical protein RI925_1135 [Pseudomonadota bacterium]